MDLQSTSANQYSVPLLELAINSPTRGAAWICDGHLDLKIGGSFLRHRPRVFVAGVVPSDSGFRWIAGAPDNGLFPCFRLHRNAGAIAGLLCCASVGYRELAGGPTYPSPAGDACFAGKSASSVTPITTKITMSWGLSFLCIPCAKASADWIVIVNAWARLDQAP